MQKLDSINNLVIIIKDDNPKIKMNKKWVPKPLFLVGIQTTVLQDHKPVCYQLGHADSLATAVCLRNPF
jgi:hypothetical protein